MFDVIYFAILVLGLGIGAFRWKALTPSLRLCWLLLLCTFLVEVGGKYLQSQHRPSLFVYSFFRPCALALILFAFNQELKIRKIVWLIPIFVVFHALNALFLQPFGKMYDSNSYVLSMLMVSLVTLVYLRKLLMMPTKESIYSFSLFLICCGYLLFNATSIFTFSVFNLLTDPKYHSAYPILQIFRIASSCLLYLTFAISFLGHKIPVYPYNESA